MKLKCVIFDFYGTLFDSMYLWDTVAESYVRSRGKEPKPTVREEVRALSILQAAEHLKKEYDLAETPEDRSQILSFPHVWCLHHLYHNNR